MNPPILEFQSVTYAAPAGEGGPIRALSFVLQPGELVLLETAMGSPLASWADLACGLVEPESGTVLFEGRSWAGLTPDEAAAARGRIGRTFDGPGWISNLDVDENITLAARYHGTVADEAAYQQAHDLARRLGLDGLPAGRPAHVPAHELRRLQWVRALLGPRRLLILERPLRDLPVGWAGPLLAEVARRRAEGWAVCWLQTRGEVEVAHLKPTLQFDPERGNMART